MDNDLKDIGFIARLSDNARTQLVRSISIQYGNKGKSLVQQGDRVSSLFLLLDGLLRIYTINPEGKEATLYHLRSGEVCLLSLNASFSNGRYPAWVSVESEEAKFALLPAHVVRSLFAEEAVIQEMVLDSLTSAIRELLTHLDEIMTCSLSERILRYVTRNSESNGKANVTHQTLAFYMGVSREAVSREILSLKKQKKIISGRGYLQMV